jgi:thioredoxin-like negative regulator of GroEL
MTKEQIAKWTGRIFFPLLIIIIIVIVFAPEGQKKQAQKSATATANSKQAAAATQANGSEVTYFSLPGSLKQEQIAEILEEAARKRGGVVVGIIHCHVPGNPDSEQIADILNRVARKYGAQVKVIRVDIIALPEIAKSEKVTKPPKVVMMAGTERACKFQGLWTQAQIEMKVDELLHGLERVSKDWLPKVKGMKPLSAPTPSQP